VFCTLIGSSGSLPLGSIPCPTGSRSKPTWTSRLLYAAWSPPTPPPGASSLCVWNTPATPFPALPRAYRHLSVPWGIRSRSFPSKKRRSAYLLPRCLSAAVVPGGEPGRPTSPQLETSLNSSHKTPISTSTRKRRLWDAGLLGRVPLFSVCVLLPILIFYFYWPV
jgi:hypothetical protein